jgi:hypothetical protein
MQERERTTKWTSGLDAMETARKAREQVAPGVSARWAGFEGGEGPGRPVRTGENRPRALRKTNVAW